MQTVNPIASATLHFEQALLPEGWRANVRLEISDGIIAAIETDTPPQPTYERHRCALPGMPNLHSHAFQRAMAGLAERRGSSSDSFWTWRDVMYRFLELVTPEDLRAIAAFAYTEMLESGFTRVGEFHYLHHAPDGEHYADIAAMSAAIAAAADESGIGLTLMPVLYSYSGFGCRPPHDRQLRFLNDIDSYARLIEGARHACRALPDAVIGIAPHSLRAASPEQFTQLSALFGDRPVHIHIAEQTQEVDDCVSWCGARPVEWLLDQVDVNERWCLVHATHMTRDETLALARSGAVAGLCPITEANLGDGIFRARAFSEAGGIYGIGSDSNVLIDATEELRLMEYGQRLMHRGRNILARGPDRSTGVDIYADAVFGGGRALGAKTGIAVGRAADIISLDMHHPSLAMRLEDQIIDSYVFAAGKDAIDCVWRYGRKLVIGGRHVRRERITARFVKVLEHLIT